MRSRGNEEEGVTDVVVSVIDISTPLAEPIDGFLFISFLSVFNTLFTNGMLLPFSAARTCKTLFFFFFFLIYFNV